MHTPPSLSFFLSLPLSPSISSSRSLSSFLPPPPSPSLFLSLPLYSLHLLHPLIIFLTYTFTPLGSRQRWRWTLEALDRYASQLYVISMPILCTHSVGVRLEEVERLFGDWYLGFTCKAQRQYALHCMHYTHYITHL